MTRDKHLVVIKGAGDLASGVAYRLLKCGLNVIMTEIDRPLAVRRKAAFAEAVYAGSTCIEGVHAHLADTVEQALDLLEKGMIPVLIDPEASVVYAVNPLVVVDGRMAKRNLGTTLEEAPLVIGLGPGFTAGLDVHGVVETCRGDQLGQVIYSGSAIPDTGIPGAVNGYTSERLLRAPVDGMLRSCRSIGEKVAKGDRVACVESYPVLAEIPGVVRGMLKEGIWVPRGTKIGDIDPRSDAEYNSFSDKALAVGGGVVEAVSHLYQNLGLSFNLS